MSEVLREAGADAALLAGVLHDGVLSLADIKSTLVRDGVRRPRLRPGPGAGPLLLKE